MRLKKLLMLIVAVFVLCGMAFAQTTSFTYQGRLTDSGNPANGNYDLQFALWDNSSGGAQIGSTQTRNSVAVSAGIFTVALDFGVSAFPGADRFLEISVRPAGGGSFTTLAPRQRSDVHRATRRDRSARNRGDRHDRRRSSDRYRLTTRT